MREPVEHWRRIDGLFAEALGLEAADRSAFLDSISDRESRAQVERLLEAHARSQSFLEHRTSDLMAQLGAEAVSEEGTRLGAYRLESRLGEGGMGVVYLARRDDDQFELQVAVKVLHQTASEEVKRRFEAERQILARLEHPHIARLLDGGVTEDGRPYLVMEHVDGLPIDRWCDERRLAVEARLELVVAVCDAVAHAHRNLLVHRDLKPANILVDTEGRPRLLDFGIAKLLAAEGRPPDSGLTRTGVRPMSPAFASPEQVRGEPVTTASDVYSLGVLLYRLLTGASPYRLESDLPHEVEVAILGQEVPAASEAAIRRRPGHVPEDVAEARGTRPRELARRLAGDLDNIVAKALSKEPADRYGGARELASDLRRHLSLRPVVARPHSVGYRLSRFVRRNRVAVAAGSTLLVASLAFGGLMGTMALSIARERDAAERERVKAKAASDFVSDLLADADPTGVLGPRGADLTVREALDRGADRVADLVGQPELKAVHLATMGRVYRSLGLAAEAEPMLEEALALRRELGVGPLALVESLDELGGLRQDQGDFGSARALFEEALALLREQDGPLADPLGSVLNNLGLLLYRLDEFEEAEALLLECLPHARALENPLLLHTALNNLAIVLHAKGDYEGAEPLYRELLSLRRESLPADHPRLAISLNNLGVLLRDLGRLDEAERLLTESLEIREVMGERHPMVVPALRNLALLAFLEGDVERSESLFLAALSISREVDPEHPMVARMLTGVARAELARGDPTAAESRLAEALTIFRARLPADHWRTAYAEAVLAACWLERGEVQRAAPVLRQAHQAIVSRLGPREPRAKDVAGFLARLDELPPSPAQN